MMVTVIAFFAVFLHVVSAEAADSISLEVAKRVNALRVQRAPPALVIAAPWARPGRAQSPAMMPTRTLPPAANGTPGRNRLTRLCLRMHAKTVGETIGW